MKTCRICKVEKDENNFCIRNKKTGNTRTECTDCLNKRKKIWVDNNPETKREIQKRYERKKFTVNCRQCGKEFVSTGALKICSRKCRLLDGMEIDKKSGCWIWKKSTSGSYGKFRFEGKTDLAHRVSYKIFKGEIPKKMCICHTCDNPLCINHDHLFIGTHKENAQDCLKKGRKCSGIDNHFSKFTDEATLEMRKMKEKGYTYKMISKIFNCSITHIYNVVKKRYRNGF